MVTEITEAPQQQFTLPRNHDKFKATDEGESPVQEANAGGDEIYARTGRLRLHVVVRVGHSLEVYHNEVPMQQHAY